MDFDGTPLIEAVDDGPAPPDKTLAEQDGAEGDLDLHQGLPARAPSICQVVQLLHLIQHSRIDADLVRSSARYVYSDQVSGRLHRTAVALAAKKLSLTVADEPTTLNLSHKKSNQKYMCISLVPLLVTAEAVSGVASLLGLIVAEACSDSDELADDEIRRSERSARAGDLLDVLDQFLEDNDLDSPEDDDDAQARIAPAIASRGSLDESGSAIVGINLEQNRGCYGLRWNMLDFGRGRGTPWKATDGHTECAASISIVLDRAFSGEHDLLAGDPPSRHYPGGSEKQGKGNGDSGEAAMPRIESERHARPSPEHLLRHALGTDAGLLVFVESAHSADDTDTKRPAVQIRLARTATAQGAVQTVRAFGEASLGSVSRGKLTSSASAAPLIGRSSLAAALVGLPGDSSEVAAAALDLELGLEGEEDEEQGSSLGMAEPPNRSIARATGESSMALPMSLLLGHSGDEFPAGIVAGRGNGPAGSGGNRDEDEDDASSLFSDDAGDEALAIEAAAIQDAVAMASREQSREHGATVGQVQLVMPGDAIASARESGSSDGGISAGAAVLRVPSSHSIGNLLRLPGQGARQGHGQEQGRERALSAGSRSSKDESHDGLGPFHRNLGEHRQHVPPALPPSDRCSVSGAGAGTAAATPIASVLTPGRRILRIHRAQGTQGAHGSSVESTSGGDGASRTLGDIKPQTSSHSKASASSGAGIASEDESRGLRKARGSSADFAEEEEELRDAIEAGGRDAGGKGKPGEPWIRNRNQEQAQPGAEDLSSLSIREHGDSGSAGGTAGTTLSQRRTRLLDFLRRLRGLARDSHDGRQLVLAAAAKMVPRVMYVGGDAGAPEHSRIDSEFLRAVRQVVGADELLLRAAQDRHVPSMAATIAALRALSHGPSDDALLWASAREAERDDRVRMEIVGGRARTGVTADGQGPSLFPRGTGVPGEDEGVRHAPFVLRSTGLESSLADVPLPSACWRSEDEEEADAMRRRGGRGTAVPGGGAGARGRDGRPLYADAFGLTRGLDRGNTHAGGFCVKLPGQQSTLFLGESSDPHEAGMAPPAIRTGDVRALMDRIACATPGGGEDYGDEAGDGPTRSRNQSTWSRAAAGALQRDPEALVRFIASMGLDPAREAVRMQVHAMGEAERNRRRAATGSLADADSLRRAWVVPSGGAFRSSGGHPSAIHVEGQLDSGESGVTPGSDECEALHAGAAQRAQALERWLRVGETGEVEETGRTSSSRKEALDACRLYDDVAVGL